ncbi:hypothetical protein VKT23_013027 [Stygiomarasmius scandens]|uniref:Nephrocystin 3-like N-terminal domain-containing protein n=1 Tax=Marasmiellus scandens TaxID=2682957 RepID=A0ABR1J4B5_9AGAR
MRAVKGLHCFRVTCLLKVPELQRVGTYPPLRVAQYVRLRPLLKTIIDMSASSQGNKKSKLGFRKNIKHAIEWVHSRSASPQPASGPSTAPGHSALPTPQAPSTPPPAPPAPPVPGESNPYSAIAGSASSTPTPHRAREVTSTAYAGFIQVTQAISECSDIFPPLKTVATGLLAIHKIVDRVQTNKEVLGELETKLNAFLLIVKKYQKEGLSDALQHRVRTFCEAMMHQVEVVQDLQDHSLLVRTAEGTKDADKISKAFRNMSILCDAFQMDTQLNTERILMDIHQQMNSVVIDKLRSEMTSYKTRQSSYGDPNGCLPGTRVKILADLEAWALNESGAKVYWLVGMAGTGKSTISHSLCEILDEKQMLGASVFCSRGSVQASDVNHIIPAIAHALASNSPVVTANIVKALKDDDNLASPAYHNLKDKFTKLIRGPIGQGMASYKTVVIDALDECSDLRRVQVLLQAIISFAPNTPLKFFIASRDEDLIRAAFPSKLDTRDIFVLHEVEKDVVRVDIEKFLTKSMSDIPGRHGVDVDLHEWPSRHELLAILDRSGILFIYAATVIRYIDHKLYRSRLAMLIEQRFRLGETNIDVLYRGILERAYADLELPEIEALRDILSFVLFLQNPLSIGTIADLSGVKNAALYLTSLTSVIHIPTNQEAAVTPFHASFPDFITNSLRCSGTSFTAIVPSDSHKMLALKCLEYMNHTLKYNICDMPKEFIISRESATNQSDNISKISAALKYCCVHWAFHLERIEKPSAEVIEALDHFLHKNLLHWIECLSILGELGTSINSLATAKNAQLLTNSKDLQQLLDDGCQVLQMNFKVIQKHAMEIYWSALVWIPKNSLIRRHYPTNIRQVPKVIVGLSKSWSPAELTINAHSAAYSVAFSPDGSRVISGLDNNTILIWNAVTGEVEAKLEGHTGAMYSVAFSQDGSRVVSGSSTVQIWNAVTGEVEAKLEGHTGRVYSVAFSQDGSRVVSGSDDRTVQIWNAVTGEVEAKLEGHTDAVSSVAFSQDGSRVVSGSSDRTVQIWNAVTGEVEAKLEGHTGRVYSVAFSQDGSRVVSGSDDTTVQIWNAVTGKVEAKLEGHTGPVYSVAFSQVGSRVVSGSDDTTVQIWNAVTGEVEAKLEGHTGRVNSVAFSQDGSRVVSGSSDRAVQIWNAVTGEVEAKLEGHTGRVYSVAFSQDGSRVVSGLSDRTVQIWNTVTGGVEAKLEGHTGPVLSVAFSQDGSRVVSGSFERTVQIWNAVTGEVEAKLEGHTDWVTSVAFSQDGSRVVSGSNDRTVQIWNAVTGEVEAKLEGHTDWVTSVAFSRDGSQIISKSWDGQVCIWNAITGDLESSQRDSQSAASDNLVHSSLSISDDRRWILGPSYDCWIPPHIGSVAWRSYSFLGDKVCLGFESGRVVVLDMAVAL